MSQIKRYPEWAAGQFQRRKNSDAKDQKKNLPVQSQYKSQNSSAKQE